MDFVQRHYSRVRATVRENYARSLYYLDGRLADATIEENKKNKTIETFLASRGDEIEVNVKNVAIEDLRRSRRDEAGALCRTLRLRGQRARAQRTDSH